MSVQIFGTVYKYNAAIKYLLCNALNKENYHYKKGCREPWFQWWLIQQNSIIMASKLVSKLNNCFSDNRIPILMSFQKLSKTKKQLKSKTHSCLLNFSSFNKQCSKSNQFFLKIWIFRFYQNSRSQNSLIFKNFSPL